MISTRPYLVRAFYDWISDNNCTPYVVVDTEKNGVCVPTEYIEDGRIVLNVSSMAVRKLNISNELLEFEAKFSGSPVFVRVPIAAIIAIYANENGRGMVFSEDDEEDFAEDGDDGSLPPNEPPPRGKPKLTIVK